MKKRRHFSKCHNCVCVFLILPTQVVISAAVTTRSGKGVLLFSCKDGRRFIYCFLCSLPFFFLRFNVVLLARPFVSISKARLEGLLAAFPKLMGEGKQHTVVETDEVITKRDISFRFYRKVQIKFRKTRFAICTNH